MATTKRGTYLLAAWAHLLEDMLVEGQSIAIGVFNNDGRLLDANDAMCYFLDTDETELRPKNEFVNPTFATLAQSAGRDVFNGLLTIGNQQDKSFVLHAKVVRYDDTIVVLAEADIKHLFEENDKMSSLNQQVNNLQRQLIKEKKNVENSLLGLKEMQQMLIHSEKMNAMGNLVAGVAHELNNPISFVYSNIFTLGTFTTQLIRAYSEIEKLIHTFANPMLSQAVADIRKQNDIDFLLGDLADLTKESKIGIERVKQIVEDLRRFSRLDEAEIKEIDLVENTLSTIAIARSGLIEKSINFTFSAPDNLHLLCYPGQLNQAILNILINAIDAVNTGGNINLSITETGSKVCIECSDDGCGIKAELQSRIFEPFYTTKPVGSGTGLGLSIAHTIICNLHKGSIELESEPGHGTKIKLIIPSKIL